MIWHFQRSTFLEVSNTTSLQSPLHFQPPQTLPSHAPSSLLNQIERHRWKVVHRWAHLISRQGITKEDFPCVFRQRAERLPANQRHPELPVDGHDRDLLRRGRTCRAARRKCSYLQLSVVDRYLITGIVGQHQISRERS